MLEVVGLIMPSNIYIGLGKARIWREEHVLSFILFEWLMIDISKLEPKSVLFERQKFGYILPQSPLTSDEQQ